MAMPKGISHLDASKIRTFFLYILPLLFSASQIKAQTPSPEDYLRQASDAEKREDYAEAERIYREAAQNYPNQPEFQKRLGIILQTELKFPESIDTFQKVLDSSPQYPEVNFYEGLSYFGLNQFEKSLEYFNRELEANPKYRRAHFFEAQAYRSLNRNADALRQYEILLQEDPSDKKALFQLIRFLKSSTLEAIDQLSNLDQNSVYILVLRAQSHVESEKYPEAIYEYKQVLAQDPNFPGIHFGLGEAYYYKIDYPSAEKELRLALAEDPNLPKANYYLADILMKGSKTTEATLLLEIVVTAEPNYMKGYFLLGKCYAAEGKLEDAVKLLEKAVELEPNDKSVHYQLGQIYKRMNQPEKFRKEMRAFEQLYAQERETKAKRLEGFRKDQEGTKN